MAQESFEVSDFIPAPPEQVYAAWLNADDHSAFTGGRAESDARIGGRFSAWDDYITGSYLELEPGRRILHSWRTTEFAPEAPDSRLEVLFVPVEGGTRLTLRHGELPDGQAWKYRQGWEEHYFQPMKRYFEEGRRPNDDQAREARAQAEAAAAPAPAPAPAPPVRARTPAKRKAAAARKASARKRTPAKKKARAAKAGARRRAPEKRKAAAAKATRRRPVAKKRTSPPKKRASPARKRRPAPKKRTAARRTAARRAPAKKAARRGPAKAKK